MFPEWIPAILHDLAKISAEYPNQRLDIEIQRGIVGEQDVEQFLRMRQAIFGKERKGAERMSEHEEWCDWPCVNPVTQWAGGANVVIIGYKCPKCGKFTKYDDLGVIVE